MPNSSGNTLIIRNTESGFVLDAKEFNVKIQKYTGATSQQWKLEPSDKGKFIIVNVGNKKVLDIKDAAQVNDDVITYPQNSPLSPNQQWYINADGTIESSVKNLVLDIYSGNLVVGQKLIAYYKTGTPNQIYQLQDV
ncbi:uncharacterized protein LOC123005563 [Tribolium madens]|uniref:uncharacterized protein LOC123005563 n=1 Tax=Tribolium madens TaxID=41895 RepID=UPI001CF7516B|nr:uncharacterized protein LOC123005563 [Tribolium madens]